MATLEIDEKMRARVIREFSRLRSLVNSSDNSGLAGALADFAVRLFQYDEGMYNPEFVGQKAATLESSGVLADIFSELEALSHQIGPAAAKEIIEDQRAKRPDHSSHYQSILEMLGLAW